MLTGAVRPGDAVLAIDGRGVGVGERLTVGVGVPRTLDQLGGAIRCGCEVVNLDMCQLRHCAPKYTVLRCISPGSGRGGPGSDEHGAVPDTPRIGREQLADVARFRLALRHFEHRTAQAVKRCGLTPQRYLLLLVVETTRERGGATVSSIARDLEMPQTTVTDLVARAVDIGLLDRTAGADGRVSHIRVTAEGRRRLLDAVDALRAERSQLRQTLVELTNLI